MALTFKSGIKYLGIGYVDANDAGWNLIGDYGIRTFTKRINYSTAFIVGTVAVVPSVVSVYMMDGSGGLRLDVKALSIDLSGFTLQVSTWDNCQIKGLGVQWIAYTQ